MSEADTTPSPEKTPTKWSPETDPDGFTFKDLEPKDWYLDVLLDMTIGRKDDQAEGLIGLTVTSNGAIVSGVAISRTEWLATVLDQYEQNITAGNSSGGLREVFEFGHKDSLELADRREKLEIPALARGFLHMKNARIVTGTNYLPVGLWRGALADITGWSLGWIDPKSLGSAG